MWRVKVVSICPFAELEGFSYFDFYSDLEAWRFYELCFKSPSVLSVYKPLKLF